MSPMQYRKIVFAKPWVVEVQKDQVDPGKVPAGHVLIKTRYTLVSPGTELACLSGKEAWFPLPGVMGYANIGEVVARGDIRADVKEGDLLFQYGSHAEYCVVDVDHPAAFWAKVPRGLDQKLVPFARMAGIAMTAIRVSGIELGDAVAVTGAGLVGNMAGQLARLQGAQVISIDPSGRRLQAARECGIPFTLDPGEGDLKAKVKELTGGKGVSTLIEATGIPKVAADSLPLIGSGGELILLGSPRGEYNTNLTEVLNYCHLYDHGYITFKGAHEWRYPVREDPFVKHSFQRNTAIVLRLMEEGRLRLEPLISHVLAPAEAPAAYAGLREKKDEYFGVIFDWSK